MKTEKFTNMCELNNTLLNNQRVKGEIGIYLETNENENQTCQNLWNTAKTVLSREFFAVNIFIKKEGKILGQQPNFIP